MAKAFSQEILGPLEKLASSVSVSWPQELTPDLQNRVLSLTNKILENEDTIGFAAPLTETEGKAEMAALAADIKAKNKHLLLIHHNSDGEVIGHLILTQNKLPNCQHIAEISRAMVHPSHRGFSVILMGMYEVLKKCAETGVEVLQLDVRANTRIHRLWEGMGFKTIGIMENYARVNGENFSGCFMYQDVELLRDRFLQNS